MVKASGNRKNSTSPSSKKGTDGWTPGTKKSVTSEPKNPEKLPKKKKSVTEERKNSSPVPDKKKKSVTIATKVTATPPPENKKLGQAERKASNASVKKTRKSLKQQAV